MASVIKYESGRRAVQFAFRGRRRTIGVGKMEKRDAAIIGRHIDRLAIAASGGTVPADTVAWLDSIRGTPIEKRLIKHGVIDAPDGTTLGEFLRRFIENRAGMKAQTREHDRQIQRQLIEHFGADKPMGVITAGDADDFRAAMVKGGLAESTIRRRIGRCRQIFLTAIRDKIVSENPFGHIPTAIKANRKRFHYVSVTDYNAVIKACPDQDWRTIFALTRIGGLRCPTEVLAMTWGDIDWERGRMRVRSTKTEHHEHGDERIVPLFPELAVELRASFEQATPGTTHIVTRYRSTRQNLRTTARRIIRNAGLTPWEKTFTNMRASRATELVAEFPQHVVTAWLGHSAKVASEFYLRVRETDYERALAKSLSPGGASDSTTGNSAQADRTGDAFGGVSRDSVQGGEDKSPRVGDEHTGDDTPEV